MEDKETEFIKEINDEEDKSTKDYSTVLMIQSASQGLICLYPVIKLKDKKGYTKSIKLLTSMIQPLNFQQDVKTSQEK